MNTPQEDYLFDPASPPDTDIVSLETRLESLRGIDVGPRPDWTADVHPPMRHASRAPRAAWMLGALVAAGLLLVASQLYSGLMRPWSVVRLPAARGSLSSHLVASRVVGVGDVIETDSLTTLRLNVGTIGRTEIRPGSRVRVVATGVTQFRLALDEGEIHARIWAPPRFFLVETPHALAVDLGCVYTLRSAADGSGFLRVENGEVELATGMGLIRVPAGNIVHIGSDGTPGLPFPASSRPPLRAAIASYEADPADVRSMRELMSRTDSSSTIVLWHLITRAPTSLRGEIYDRIRVLAPSAAHSSRAAVVRAEPTAMEDLRATLATAWSVEKPPLWKRWWRALWR